MTSATMNGINVVNLGLGKEWTGGNMDKPGGGMKIRLLRDYLQTVKSHEIVVFTDAYDVFYTADLDTIARRFLDFKVDDIKEVNLHLYHWVHHHEQYNLYKLQQAYLLLL